MLDTYSTDCNDKALQAASVPALMDLVCLTWSCTKGN